MMEHHAHKERDAWKKEVKVVLNSSNGYPVNSMMV